MPADKPPIEYDTVQSVQLAVTCTACNVSFIVHPEHAASQPVKGEPEGVVERGFRCPNCKHFYRSGWDNPGLAKMRYAIAKARGKLHETLIEQYMRAYEAFQDVMKQDKR